MKTFSMGGIHPNDSKISKNANVEILPLPKSVFISMAQHLGAPANVVVAVKDEVKAGQIIGEPAGFISAYVHSSVSGVVKSIGPRKDISGKLATHVEIIVNGQEWVDGVDLSDDLLLDIPSDNKLILERIKLGGVVGLGGATFPAHVKLCPPPGKSAEFLILNGTECEPYLTSDHRLMVERPKQVIVGAAIMRQVLGGCRTIIGIEENKPEAISSMKAALVQLGKESSIYNEIEIVVLKKKYPQGGEKQLIEAVTKRQVKSMGLPIDVGAVVQNVTTSFAVYEAVLKNKPLTTNILTVTGDLLAGENQKNIQYPIGVPLTYIAEYAGGIPENAAKIISGGPMMGKAIVNMDATTVKGSSSILYLTKEQTQRREESVCIRCGRCVDGCPMGLEPYLLYKLSRNNMLEELEENAAQDCIECGCCLYNCPAGIPLLDMIRPAKGDVIKEIRNRSVKK